MIKTIRFYKISDGPQKGWYADIPNHTLEDNEMVAGSDTFLEEVNALLDGHGEVNITVSDDNPTNGFIAKLIMKSHDDCGAEYILTGPLAQQYDAVGFNSGFATSHTMSLASIRNPSISTRLVRVTY